jgi:LmbE family N-acetylglucosaminyl deacetylase
MRLTDIASIRKDFDHVYLSPHLDDAAVSCGGRIAQQAAAGESVLVVTLFARDPGERGRKLRPELHPLADVQTRRREDGAAMARLGADHLHLDFDDALFRFRIALRRYGLLLGARDIDKALFGEISGRVEAICRKAGARHLYAPLGVGQHVDHQLAFQVARRVLLDTDLGTDVIFYEDCPYVFVPNMLRYRARLGGIDLGGEGTGEAAGDATNAPGGVNGLYRTLVSIPTLQLDRPLLGPLVRVFVSALDLLVERMLLVPADASGLGRLLPEVCDISAFLQAKLDAVAQYDSQMASHLLDREVLRRQYQSYSRRIGAMPGPFLERYWRTAPKRTDGNGKKE